MTPAIEAPTPEVGLDRLSQVSPTELHPSPENDTLYRRVLPADAAIVELAERLDAAEIETTRRRLMLAMGEGEA